MPIFRYKAVIFDLDGTLLNTLSDLRAAVNFALSSLNLPTRTPDEIRLAVGDGIGNLIARSIEGGKESPYFDVALARFRDYYAAHNQDATAPYDGILPMLHTLRKNGILIGVVSNKIDSAVKTLVAQYFPDLIDYAVGEREGVRRKPCPDSLLACIESLSLSPEDCLYVGDSEQDILTAQNAAIPCLSVTWGFRDPDTLLLAGATTLVNTPKDLLTYLNT